MKNKSFVLLLSVLLFSLSLVQFSFSKARWVKVGDNWRYELREGTGNYVMERWREIADDGINEKVYYFDAHGNMVTGPIVINGSLYVYAETGEAITTGFDIDNLHYDTDGKGKVLGLPPFFDLSRFRRADSAAITLTIPQNEYDNNIIPTAAPQAQ